MVVVVDTREGACWGGGPTFQSAGESVGRTHLVEPPQTKGVDGLLDRRGS